MLFVYLSDKSIETIESNDPPETGTHLGKKWIPVFQEVCEWRRITNVNQIALMANINDVREVERQVSHFKNNSPTQPFMNNVLVSLKNEIGSLTIVEIPVDEFETESDGEGEIEDMVAEEEVAIAFDEEE